MKSATRGPNRDIATSSNRRSPPHHSRAVRCDPRHRTIRTSPESRALEASAELVAKHPARFGGFAVLPLPDVAGALEELEYALDTVELDGIVLFASQSDGRYLGDPDLDELLAELDRRSAVTFIHPAIPASLPHVPVDIPVFAMEFTFDTTRAVFNLAYTGALERYPNIRFILSHAGGTVPYLARRFSLLWLTDPELMKRAPKGGMHYLQQLYYDTALSANPHALRSPERVRSLVLCNSPVGIAEPLAVEGVIKGASRIVELGADGIRATFAPASLEDAKMMQLYETTASFHPRSCTISHR